ncbi:MAG TPA: hypothetical protein VKU19_01065 [Bryobacteraceae bacterium]|nr:hypothetical protein [Bryobacteraceae bacterium]
MLSSLVRTGDAWSIRVPATLLEQIGLQDVVELVAEKGRLIVRPARVLGGRWESALASLAERVEEAGGLGEVPDLPLHKSSEALCRSSPGRPERL